MADSIELPDGGLAALSARYPDISFDMEGDFAPGPLVNHVHFSSPTSVDSGSSEAHNSKNSATTANTTPLRSPRHYSFETLETLGLETFCEEVDATDLPRSCKEWFKELANAIMRLSLSLRSQTYLHGSRYLIHNCGEVVAECTATLYLFRQCNARVMQQVRNIAFIKTRAPFTIEPGPQDLWCMYRQRAILIAEYTTLPCRAERLLLQDLAILFNDFVYQYFLTALQLNQINGSLEDAINRLYDSVMKLLHSYNLWWTGMRDLRESYMLPLMRRIQQSPEILGAIRGFENATGAVKTLIDGQEYGVPESRRPADRFILGLNHSQIRREIAMPEMPAMQSSIKEKFRREATL